MKAWELLSRPGAWTQGSFARDVEGEPGMSLDEDVVCWCAVGAINKCYEGQAWCREAALKSLMRRVGNIAQWNDRSYRTKEEVVALLKELDI
jgi:hypothetical protein